MRKRSLPGSAVFTLAIVLTGSVLAAAAPSLAKAPFNGEQAKEFQQQWANHIGKERVYTNSIGMKMVMLPPGEFMMGIKDGAAFNELRRNMLSSDGHWDRVLGKGIGAVINLPGHRVRLNKPFYMGAHEVTVGQFRQFIEQSGYKTDAERGIVYEKPYEGKQPIRTWQKTFYEQPNDHPVLQVGWKDCMAFCNWLSKQEANEGHVYSLPTDAEWEYAGRAGTTTMWHFGDPDVYKQVAQQYANMSWKSGTRPIAVGQKKPNAFGLFDMHGNLCEWVADWHHWYYYLESPLNDPTGPATQNEHKITRRWVRGGAFNVSRYWARSDMRIRIHQGSNQHDHVGFRVAMHVKGIKGVEPAEEPNMRIVGQDKSPADPVAAQQAAVTKDRPRELKIKLSEDVSMDFVLVPAGSFLMGSLKGGRFERPVHQVVIRKPFYIGKYEVTQAQWNAVMGKENHKARWGEKTAANLRKEWVGPNKPMFRVSWNDWQDFIKGVRRKVPKRDFSLPTEAQWEYACRAGSKTEYCFGDDPALLKEYAWITPTDAPHPRERTWPDLAVGGRKPNKWGIHDMHGNAWEWCQDWCDKDYYSKSPLTDPQGPAKGNFKVLRGGAVKSYGRFARSAFRLFINADVSDDDRTLLTSARLVINLPSDDPILVAHRGLLRHAPQNTGTIEGVVTYSGDVPKSKVPDNAGQKRNLLSVNRKSRGLRYVLVYLEPDEKNQVDSDKQESQNKEAVSDAIVIDQVEHTFVPHLIAIRDATKVKFTNSDAANHNVRAVSFESKNQFNVFTGAGGEYVHQFAVEKKLRPILLSCDIHPWMRAWIYVFSHPFFAVTDEHGKFRIGLIPPGGYRLTIRQPDVGYLKTLTGSFRP